jgi:hypothetical protein
VVIIFIFLSSIFTENLPLKGLGGSVVEVDIEVLLLVLWEVDEVEILVDVLVLVEVELEVLDVEVVVPSRIILSSIS